MRGTFRSVVYLKYNILLLPYYFSSVIRQKWNIKKEITRKESTSNFMKNKHFLPSDTHKYVCVSRGRKYSFFGKFGELCFLVTSVLRFVLLPYCRRFALKINVIVLMTKRSTTQVLIKMMWWNSCNFVQKNSFNGPQKIKRRKYRQMLFDSELEWF